MKSDVEHKLKEFSERTTCHGIAQIFSRKNRVHRYIWILLVIAVVATLSSQLVTRVMQYAMFKTTTVISEKHVSNLQFPSVTVCNFNSLFSVTEDYEYQAATLLLKAKIGYIPITTSGDGFDGDDYNDNDYNSNYYNGEDYYTDGFKFFGNYNNSVLDYMNIKGWQLDDKTLKWCTYGPRNCTIANFTSRLTNMGKCWTFQTSIPTWKPGSRSGLSIGLDIQEDQYFLSYEKSSHVIGIRVQVHPQYEEPQVKELGLAVSGGKRAFISAHQSEINLMKKPWGECRPESENLNYFDTYSVSNCFNECWRKRTGSCGCGMYDVGMDKKIVCDPQETTECIAKAAILQRKLTVEKCNCQPACKTTDYMTTISYADLQTSDWVDLTNEEGFTEYILKNIVGVNVFFDRMSITKQDESEATTFTAFLSDLGGQLGFWMGISVLTVFEFLQLLLEICKKAMNHTKASSSMSKTKVIKLKETD
ncbi:acid-sensing ion channel 1C-like [Styela clava]